MGHQGQDDWYPECKICNSGNLGDGVVCEDCYQNKIKSLILNGGEIGHILQDFTREHISGLYYYISGADFIKVVQAICDKQKEKLSK